MNTEPPEGDELQRMLVSMKQTVLERAAPRPRRRHGRAGVAVGVIALLALGTATGAVALTLSQQDRPVAAPAQTAEPVPAPSATTPSSAPITGRPTPRPVPTPTAPTVATVPTSCRATVPAEEYDRLFGGREAIQVDLSGSEQEPEVVAASGRTDLYCAWGAADGPDPGLSVIIGSAIPEGSRPEDADIFSGWDVTCADDGAARICRATSADAETGTTAARTRYERDDTWIEINQSDFPTNGLLDAVVGEIWGD